MDSEQSAPVKKSLMARSGHALIAASENQGCRPMLWRFLRGLTLWSVLLYVIGLVLFTLALGHVGERNPATAFLIFLPPALWWLPALPLGLAALLFHRGALLVLTGVLAWFSYDFLGWRPGGGAEGETETLRVMTYNRGQHMNQSLQPFKDATRPDVIVMQEAPGRAAGFAAASEYREFSHTQNLREHTILSRYPIIDQTELGALPGKSPKAVRFVLDWNGRHVALYSVHLQSPREVLGYQMRGAFLYGIIGLPGTPWEEKRRQLQTFWDDQIADAELVLKAVREDPLPTIVAGDFNAPHTGFIHRLITRELGDAHARAGKGFGLTFPGSTRNPLSGGGPWMRIDYVFFGVRWRALECVTEPDRPSQHRAVMAVLTLKDP